jgi:hypothetical protein
MQLNQAAGIDLPFKALVWENHHGETLLTYNDPKWLVERHQLGKKAEETGRAISVGTKGSFQQQPARAMIDSGQAALRWISRVLYHHGRSRELGRAGRL